MLVTADCEGGNGKHIRQVGEDHWAAHVLAISPVGHPQRGLGAAR